MPLLQRALLSRARCRACSGRGTLVRRCAGGRSPDPPRPSEGPKLAAVGVVGGAVGSVVGIGGGNVMVPLMTLLSRSLTQHQISATSLVAVVGTGAAAAGSYVAAGAVHLPAAALITLAATATAPLGAKLAARLPATHLRLCLAVFVLGCAPLVPLKGIVLKDRAGGARTPSDEVELSARSAAVVFGTGCLAGLASGLLGIGGGVVLTPALALATDLPQQAVLGTSLTAMILPSVAGALTHYRAGTIVLSAAGPLAGGAALGALLGGRFALSAPEEELRWIFASVMGCLGVYMLRGAVRGLGWL